MTTYTDAVKRARLAYGYGQVKRAAGDATQNAKYNQDLQDSYNARNSHYRDKAMSEQEAANAAGDAQVAAANKQKEAEDAKIREGQQHYISEMNGIVNRAKGEQASRDIASANDYLKNQVPQNIDDAQILKMLELGSLPQELYPQAAAILSRMKDENAEAWGQKLDDDAHTASQDAAAQAKIDAYRAEQDRIKARGQRNLGIGIGAGVLGGGAVGGAAYGLAGLFPSLKKRRLLRALMALGVGGAAGAGIGYGVTSGLNSGKINIG